MKRYILLSICLIAFFPSNADEGMWLPLHIKRLNEVDMQKMGLQLTAEEIYSVNNSSLKDAIVSIGGFCTGEMISKDGLMLTNHHCAYDAIQSHSSVKDDYLSDGFWAMSKDEELPNEGLTASFLVEMMDVTDVILSQLSDTLSEASRSLRINELSDSLEANAIKDTHYNARIKSFFNGNEYYLFVYETFEDIRLVGAPPSSIGKYGGDTDNWMWPRHTGDFALLRVYTDPEGKPAPYSPDNIAYHPKHHLPLSIAGVEQDDFAMIVGYPGGTDRFLTSHGVKQALEVEQPARIKIREKRLQIMKEDMDADPAVRIQYASKHAQVSNYYKYFKGQSKGLKRLKVYDKKKGNEEKFTKWVNEEESRTQKYGAALNDIGTNAEESDLQTLVGTYFGEAIFGIEMLQFAYGYNSLLMALAGEEISEAVLNEKISSLKKQSSEYFGNYNMPTDKKVCAAMLEMYYNGVPAEYHPKIFEKIEKKYKGDFAKYAESVYSKSFFASPEKLNIFLENPTSKKLIKDPGYQLMFSAFGSLMLARAASGGTNENLSKSERLYIEGLREMNPQIKYYPDANFTMRLTYGQVLDYFPRDAVYYNFYTTFEGMMEKEDPDNPEFIVPPKLKELYLKKDYGQYAEDGKLHVCFLTNHDITGGNSGSPVINANGELIGVAFDGNWEAMSGDIAFEKELQRSISVDIRYVLFIIDKYAGAKHLIEEMDIVTGTEDKAQKEGAINGSN